MVPNINDRGHSFKGVTQYLMRDKGGATTSHRVGNTSVHNVGTEDVWTAARRMAFTDKNRLDIRAANGGAPQGRPATAGNVYHYSLAWHPGQNPTWEEMQEAAHESVRAQGLQEHEYYMVEHTEEPQRHVHVVVNLVHPVDGRIQKEWKDIKIADRWANEYEKEHGEVVCPNRAKKYETWENQIENGEEPRAFEGTEGKRDHSKIITECFQQSDSGKALCAALESHGLTLALGRRRSLSVVDERGDVHGLTRNVVLVEGKRTPAKTVNAKLTDIDKDTLRDAEELKQERRARIAEIAPQKEPEKAQNSAPDYDPQQAETDRQIALLDAAEKHADALAKQQAKPAKPKPKKSRPKHVLSYEEKREQERKNAERDYHRRVAAFERQVAEKTAAAREKWQIDHHQEQRDQALENLDAVSGFWSRNLFRRGRYKEAYDAFQNAEHQLQERTARFKHEIEYLNRNRPEFRVREELEKQGIDPAVEMPSRDEKLRDKAIAEKLDALRAKLPEHGQEGSTLTPPPQVQSVFSEAGKMQLESPANDNAVEEQELDPRERKRQELERAMLEKFERDREEDREQDQGLGL